MNWISQPFCIMAIATGKISVAFLILRILAVTGIWKRRILYCAIYSVFLCATVNTILIFTQCIPTRALWTPSVALHAKCFSPTILTICAMVVSCKFIVMSEISPLKMIGYYAMVDLFLALIPLIIIKDLKMKRKRKITLIAVLSLGVL